MRPGAPTLWGLLPPKAQVFFPEYRREAMMKRSPQLAASEELKEARMYRAVYSNRQLEEVLVDYWFNHFNIQCRLHEKRRHGGEPRAPRLLVGPVSNRLQR